MIKGRRPIPGLTAPPQRSFPPCKASYLGPTGPSWMSMKPTFGYELLFRSAETNSYDTIGRR